MGIRLHTLLRRERLAVNAKRDRSLPARAALRGRCERILRASPIDPDLERGWRGSRRPGATRQIRVCSIFRGT